jgi:hypothetical protein
MAKQVQALFVCHDVLERKAPDGASEAQIVKLFAAYENNPDHPNFAFWKATPTGTLEMTVSNPAAFALFARGRRYLLTFEPVEEKA